MAVGEASCTSVHGANRLAGNNMTEELVFGKAAALATAELYKPGAKVKEFAQNAGLETIEKVSRLRNSQGDIGVRDLKERLQKCMSKYVGLVRDQKLLEEGTTE
jgi:succinate dehydrogenase (ubiquinone) flavoprotein subunit